MELFLLLRKCYRSMQDNLVYDKTRSLELFYISKWTLFFIGSTYYSMFHRYNSSPWNITHFLSTHEFSFGTRTLSSYQLLVSYFLKLLMKYSNTGKRTRRQASPCIPNRTCYLTQAHALPTGLLCGDRRVLEPLLMILAVYVCNYT